MKKAVLKLVTFAFILTIGLNSVMAQPPVPPSGMGENKNGKDLTQGKTSINRQQAPVGTATLLMLGLGGAFLGYKLRQNNKEE